MVEVFTALATERVDEHGALARHRNAVRVLAVEHAQWILVPRLLVLVAQSVDVGRQMCAQLFHVRGATGRVAHRVDEESKTGEADRLVETVSQRDDFDVHGGVLGAEHLDAELVVLAVTALLGTLVAKGRGEIPGLPRRRGTVLDEGPHDRGGSFGTQRVGALAAVGEDVHLLGGHLTLFTDASVEDADVLEHGGDDQFKTETVGELRERRDESFPLRGGVAEDVVGPNGGLKRCDCVAHEFLFCPGS